MFDKGYYYWHYRFDATNELAVVVRCTDFLDMSTLFDHFNAWRARNLIRDEDMIPDRNITREEGWELALAFDLCPCMEISRTGKGNSVRCSQVTLP